MAKKPMKVMKVGKGKLGMSKGVIADAADISSGGALPKEISSDFWDRLFENFEVSENRSFGDDLGDDVRNFWGSTFQEF